MGIATPTLAKYLKPGDLFIETGTDAGGCIAAAISLGASQAWSCDVLPASYMKAMDRLAAYGPAVVLALESSPDFLRRMLPGAVATPRRSVLWLDAHDPKQTPILQELQAIRASGFVPDVILIDDIRYFRSGFWGIKLPAVVDAVMRISAYDIVFENGEGQKVDVLDGPAYGDILAATK